jgi:hypothetical protein
MKQRSGYIQRRTPLRLKTPLRGSMTRKVHSGTKTRSRRQNAPNKRISKVKLSKLKKKLWEECKRVIRLRYVRPDGTWKCYTCDARLDVPAKAQTGHFIPSSVCSTEMRYDLGNLRIQCYRCNINLSGNWIEYEKRLNMEMGKDYTERLKARNVSTRGSSYREDWYVMYIKNYKDII